MNARTEPEVQKSKFELLAAININDHVEKKNGLSYVSWAWAVDQLLRQDPDAEWEYLDPKTFGGDTVMVYCCVTAFGKKKTAHLPVMDYKNRAIPMPNAFEMNTAMQRCLVKAIALHGLGLYIYAGEDLPEGEAKPEKDDDAGKITPRAGAKERLTPEQIKKVEQAASKVTDWINSGSIGDAVAEKENAGLDADETVYFWGFFDSKARAAMKKEYQRQHAGSQA
jgi:hypothetical protein